MGFEWGDGTFSESAARPSGGTASFFNLMTCAISLAASRYSLQSAASHRAVSKLAADPTQKKAGSEMVADRRRLSLVAPHRGLWRERPNHFLAYRLTLECDVSD